MGKEISFSEFLKEGAISEEKIENSHKPQGEKPIRIVPETPVTDSEMKAFWKQVRHFFRTGERPSGTNGNLVPALIAPYLKAANFTNDYPIFIDGDLNTCTPLSQFIQDKFNSCFGKGEAVIVQKNIPRILKLFRDIIKTSKHTVSFSDSWKVVYEQLKDIDVHGDKQSLFIDHLDTFSEALPLKGTILPFTEEAAFIMLHLQLEKTANSRSNFMIHVKQKVDAIKELLDGEEHRKPEKSTKPNIDGFDFANDVISMDKLSDMMPTEGTVGMPAERVERLKQVVADLTRGNQKWNKYSGFLIITEELFKSFPWGEIMPKAHIESAGINEGYKKTEQLFDQNIKDFTKFMVAIRIADLELKEKYRQDVHTDFYNHFSWHRLTKEELNFFPTVIFIGEAQGFLKNNLTKFSALLSANKPIRLMAIDKRLVNEPNPNINWEDASHSFRQELAAIAFAHRSTHTFQCAINQPINAYNGMSQCLQVDAPSIMHFLIPDSGEVDLTEVLKLSAAVEGRFFPSITYDLNKGNKWGSRFDISANSSPDKNWPEYDITFVDVDGHEKTQLLPFTYSDYKALTIEKVEELFLIPESFKSDDLMQISDFLQAPVEDLTGKVPYIWLVNEDNILTRAALPYMWVVSCQERLDNWNYIQELGGINSYHVKEALSIAESNWNVKKQTEINALKEEHAVEIQKERDTAGKETLKRLTNVLLGLETNNMINRATQTERVDDNPSSVAKEEKETEEEKPIIEVDASSNEPWLESFNCTTCNECVEKYPHIFKYNSDKQAIIHDFKTAKYSELVLAAEECPANCIHPGEPINKDEADLEEFIERAIKYK